MKALVVYESMFGNTRRIAEAVAEGLRTTAEVDLREVSAAPAEPDATYDLVVIGGPTHAFSLSRRRTRGDAVKQGASPDHVEIGVREWLDDLPTYGRRTGVATFDTRVSKVRHLPGSAAKSAAKSARRHGYRLGAPPESFYVLDSAGPLCAGEISRARTWGQSVGAAALATAVH